MDTDNTDSKKRRGAEGGSSFAAAAMEDRAGNSEKGHGEEGERIIDRCPNGVGLVEGAIFDFSDATVRLASGLRRSGAGKEEGAHATASARTWAISPVWAGRTWLAIKVTTAIVSPSRDVNSTS